MLGGKYTSLLRGQVATIRPARLAVVVLLTQFAALVGTPVSGAHASQGAQAPPHQAHEVAFPEAGDAGTTVPQTAPSGDAPPPIEVDTLLPELDPTGAQAFHVKFAAGRGVAMRRTGVDGLAPGHQAELSRALRNADATIEPLFEQRRRRRSGRAVIDLSLWARVEVGDPSAAAALSRTLNQLAVVEVALPEPALASASLAQPPPSTIPDFEPNQLHHDPAPAGIDVDYARTVPGGRGENVTISDLEYSWNTSHVDLADAAGAALLNGTPEDPFDSEDHGTAVLGLIGAEDNGFGVTGVAPDAELQLVNVFNTEGSALADAIDLATANSEPGDVILIEQQLCTAAVVNNTCGPGWLPVEWFPSFYDAIVAATSAGLVVVQAGGNGSRDIDAALTMPDSGAIIVGAGNPSTSCNFFGSEPGRGRLGFSNYGTRMDLQGPGACVWSTGSESGAIDETVPDNERYTAFFSGTSSAAAVVAAAAGSVSSVAQAASDPLEPAEIRALLRATGSPQDFTFDTRPIGPLPDLRGAIQSFLDTPHPGPTNDDFFDAMVLDALPQDIVQDTVGATVQGGEPIASCGSTHTTVWYSFTAPADLTLSLSTRGSGRAPSIGFWQVTEPETLREVRCQTGGADPVDAPFEVALQAGERYLIQVGSTGGARVRISLTGVPGCDIDGDGFGDVLIGAPGETVLGNAASGAVNLFHGHREGEGDVIPEVSQASLGIRGAAEADDRFGSSVACIDVDGDGHDDAVVGVPGEDRRGLADTGSVQVIFGNRDGLSNRDQRLSQASPGVPGMPEAGDRFGESLAVGDVNGDGYGDVVVGAPGESIAGGPDAGMAIVLYGSAQGLKGAQATAVHQNRRGVPGRAEAGDGLGAAVTVGDTDGDGYDEVIIGVPGEDIRRDDVGAVLVVPGSARGAQLRDSRWLTPRQSMVSSRALAGARFGAAVALGDVSGDGHPELLVGVPGPAIKRSGAAGGGWVDVLPGSAAGIGFAASSVVEPGVGGVAGPAKSGALFGASVLGVDLDGSGSAELYAGSPSRPVSKRLGAGAFTVVDFGAGMAVEQSELVSQNSRGVSGRANTGDRFGAELHAEDVNGDGFADLLVAAPGERRSVFDHSGMVLLVPGSRSGMNTARDRPLHQGSPGVASDLAPNDTFGNALG